MLLALAAALAQLLDVRAESGIEFVHASGDPEKRTILSSLGGGAALFDYDGDADLDLYLVGKGANQLYRNLGGFRFENVSDDAGVLRQRVGTSAAPRRTSTTTGSWTSTSPESERTLSTGIAETAPSRTSLRPWE